MADKKLESITFPDLPDRYVVKPDIADVTGLQTALDDKANIDGTYDNMTVGNAKQLVSNVFAEDTEPYLFRTAGGSIDIGDRETDMLVGGTVGWNQLSENGNFESSSKWGGRLSSISVSSNIATITPSSDGTDRGLIGNDSTKPYATAGNKYLLAVDVLPPISGSIGMGLSQANISVSATANVWNKCSAIWTTNVANEYRTNLYALMKESLTTSQSVKYKNAIIIDLTQLFGSTIADYIYSLEQATAGAGVAFFRKYFPNSYYPYNAGELVSVSGLSAHKTTGFNQWDEEWEVGNISSATGQNETSDQVIRSKNYIHCLPNTTYNFTTANATILIFYYDENKNFIDYQQVSSPSAPFTKTMPSNCHYMRFRMGTGYGTTYNHDICINLHWDGERDGEYEAYTEHTYPLDDITLRGIPKLADGKMYYDGDRYEADGTVNRRYEERAYQSGDESLADAITDGTKTVVKKTTPTTETADPFASPQIVDNWGTEEYVSTNGVPVGHSTKYPLDLRSKLETLANPPSGDGEYILKQTSGEDTYVSLAGSTTISGIIARIEALENA